jgi:hypothetical protein
MSDKENNIYFYKTNINNQMQYYISDQDWSSLHRIKINNIRSGYILFKEGDRCDIKLYNDPFKKIEYGEGILLSFRNNMVYEIMQ